MNNDPIFEAYQQVQANQVQASQGQPSTLDQTLQAFLKNNPVPTNIDQSRIKRLSDSIPQVMQRLKGKNPSSISGAMQQNAAYILDDPNWPDSHEWARKFGEYVYKVQQMKQASDAHARQTDIDSFQNLNTKIPTQGVE